MRYFIEIAYKGTNYNGWQVQPNAITVQQKVNEALSTVLRHEVQTLGSGRTDTGVHARSQFAHFDSDVEITTYGYLLRINGILPKDIKVVSIFKATDNEAHARFSAISRSYRYEVCLKQNPFLYELSTFLKRKPNVDLMNQASALMLGSHDFAAYCKFREGSTTIRNLQRFQWTRDSAGLLIGDVVADSFCYSMVRNLVGAVVCVADGRFGPEWIEQTLANKVRISDSLVFPACGLSLRQVDYPSVI